jgi:hypothetical protein
VADQGDLVRRQSTCNNVANSYGRTNSLTGGLVVPGEKDAVKPKRM